MRLTDDQIKMARITYTKVVQDDFILDLIDTIETQRQEIEKLKELLADWKYNTKCDADHIAALTADKDEQARTIMRLANGLKKLRSSLQWLKETIHDLDYKAWAEDNIGKIDALLGGKEDA